MNNYIPNNRVSTIRHYLKVELLPLYDSRESEQIVKELFHHFLNWTATDLIIRKEQGLSESEILLFHHTLKKLKQGVPLQYAIGKSHFMGLDFHVSPAVLIPRPETEELVRLITATHQGPLRILDVGTGSGCIGLALKKELPHAAVTLLDASAEALEVAKENAIRMQLEVDFVHADILHYRSEAEHWDIIVSNPPYIPLSDKSSMAPNVVKHEPHMALFVTDQNPLIFYERLLQIARMALKPQGKIYFEIHERMSDSLQKLCKDYGIQQFKFHRDLQGKERMLVIG